MTAAFRGAAALALVLALAAQATSPTPAGALDRSTPEATFAEWTRLWREATQDQAAWAAIRAEAEAATEALRTPAFRERRAAARAQERALAERTRFVWGEFHVSEKVVGADTAMLVVWLDMKIRTPDFATPDGYREQDHKEPYRFHFQKVGADWRVSEMWKVCPTCSGTTSCPRCSGTGLYQYGTCTQCSGRRLCSGCGGKAMVQGTLTHHLLIDLGSLLLAEDGAPFAASTDTSTPQAAATAYMHSWTTRELVQGRRGLAWLEPRWKTFLELLAPVNAAAAQIVLDGELAAGRKRLQTITRAVDDPILKGDAACVKTTVTLDGIQHRQALLVERAGDGWLVGGELRQACIHCAGQGICFGCKGTGTLSGEGFSMQCLVCNGKKSCDPCKGLGMVE